MTAGVLQPPVSRRVLNLGDLMTQTAGRLPDLTAFVRGEKSWTWVEQNARVDAFAHALNAAGIEKGDRVLIQARNSNQMFEALFACFKAGAVAVPVNFRLAPPEVAYIAGHSGARAIVHDDVFAEHSARALETMPECCLHVVIGENAGGEPAHNTRAFEDLVAAHHGKMFHSARVSYDDACWFFFTSGTTGHPKAAVLTHGQMSFVVTNHLADLMPGTTHADASLVVAPLSHGAGIHQLSQVARGARTVLLPGEGLDPDAAFRLIEEHKVSNMFTVPTILKRLAESAAADAYDHSSLRHVIYAGAPMYRSDQQMILSRLGKCIVQYFGLGEVTGNITVLPAYEHDVDDDIQTCGPSCGYARTAMDVRIFDMDGNPCSRDEQGEICVAGPAVFAGYYDNDEANDQAFRDGFFRTGDLGFLDDAGYLTITGRASDMYISGGTNIYPRQIEEVILTHPAVAEVAVLGLPDAEWGEAGVAVLVLRPGAELEPEALSAWLGGKIARYKLPKQVFIWDELPKSAYGKVPKRLIREKLLGG